jgi:hypothetical protein
VSKQFLAELLPVVKRDSGQAEVRFPLQRPSQRTSVSIANRNFVVQPNLYVLITDMRNSTGEKVLTPELKVKTEGVIDHLRSQEDVRSQTVYDDSRVLACETLTALSRSIRRLHNSLQPYRTDDGFRGIRAGCTRGEMLFDCNLTQDWREIRRSAALDTADNTIAAAARLMALDKLRFEPERGEVLRTALGDWDKDESLLFLDSRVYEELPPEIQRLCRDVSILELKGIGRRRCWAIPISLFDC